MTPNAHLANRSLVAVAVATAAGFLAACGGSGGTPRPSPSQTTAPAQHATTRAASHAIIVRSPAFAPGGQIPARFTCKGSNAPPPLTWSRLPAGTASIALVMDDPDAPGGTYIHWVVFNLPAGTSGIGGGRLPSGAGQAQNSGGQAGYTGPCPPSGTHHYRFTIYAERATLKLPDGAALGEALSEVKRNAVGSGRLTGLFGSS